MKKIIFIIVFYFFRSGFASPFGGDEGAVFAQVPTDCPKITFSYDASGNRVKRTFSLSCSEVQRNTNENPDKPDSSGLQVNVFPNPAENKINIELEEDDSEPESRIFLYDVNGKEIYGNTTVSLQIEIDVSALSAGHYLLKIRRGGNFRTYNVMKN